MQPQDVVTLVMIISLAETLVKLKTNGAVVSPGLRLYSLVSASKTNPGVCAVAGVAPTVSEMGAGLGAGSVDSRTTIGCVPERLTGAGVWAKTVALKIK